MIPVEIYSNVYYAVISIFTGFFCFRYYILGEKAIENKTVNSIYSFVLLSIVILFIGLRDPYGSYLYFGDTGAYTFMFNNINEPFYEGSKDLGFFSFLKLLSFFNSLPLFYLTCACLYILPVYYTFKKWFSEKAILALLVYVGSLSFWAFGINGVRNGLAVSFFLFAIGFTNRRTIMLLFMLISISFHKSMILPVAVFFVAPLIKNTNKIILIWGVCVILSLILGDSITDFLGSYLSIFDDPRVQTYLSLTEELEDNVSKSFRYDFVLYSAVPIVCAYYYISKMKINDSFYLRLVNTYLIVNSVWVLFCQYLPYTNRFAFLSWFLIPVLLVYPMLKMQMWNNQHNKLIILIVLNLLFTLLIFSK